MILHRLPSLQNRHNKGVTDKIVQTKGLALFWVGGFSFFPSILSIPI